MESLKTLQEAIRFFSDFDNCRQFMVGVRWPDAKVLCPRCGSDKVIYLQNARVYKCRGKHAQAKYSLKVGTVFEDSPIPLEKWLPAVWLLVNCKNGVSSYEISRALGVTQKSAWFMLHRIRLAMQTGDFGTKLGGPESQGVEVDETFIGGKPKNMHKGRRLAINQARSEMNTCEFPSRMREKPLCKAFSTARRGRSGQRYLDEQVFRYNNRSTKDNPLTDADRFALALSQIVGKRLTYAEVTGKAGETAF